MTESQEPIPLDVQDFGAVPDSAASVLTCPIDGSTEFKHIPVGNPHFTCFGGCGKVWHESDLSGERFQYLKDHP